MTHRLWPILIALLVLAGCTSDSPTAPPASATPGQTAAPSATPNPRLAVVDAFYEWARNPDISYSSVQRVRLGVAGTVLDARARYDFEAGNARVAMTLRGAGQRVTFDFLIVGDWAYVKLAGKPWQRMRLAALETGGASLDAFEFIRTRSDLRYGGTETSGRRTLHSITNSDPLRYSSSNASIRNAVSTVTDLVVLVTDKGLPVSMRYHVTVRGNLPNGARVEGAGDVTQTFKRHGRNFQIIRPRNFKT